MLGAAGGFHGTNRFVVEGRLGEGGFGVVHQARDVERGEVVALKTMTRLDPGALLRFKHEFRALADISHANVVQLYELFSEGDHWFFTMELVDGCDLLAWVHSSLSKPPPAPVNCMSARDPNAEHLEYPTLLAPTELSDTLGRELSAPWPPTFAEPAAGVRARFAVRDVARLRGAFRQLAGGVQAIHAAGKLHRDIKPSNVMVTRGGRVVLLDFGVVGEYRPGLKESRSDEALVGTPAYMAPEQAAFRPATPASDWYAVGVILFEALTRRMPFEGSTSDLLLAKQRIMPLAPSALVDGIPPDLEQLCVELLSLDPSARPTGDQVLRRLEGDRRHGAPAATTLPFVGRRDQLEALDAALVASRSGGPPVVVMLSGHSGMGKSALVSRFLASVAAGPETLVLAGRCYEREAVPFKAVDQVVDELSRWLARLPEEEAYGLLPPGVHALARLFPVLRNARVVAEAPDGEPEVADPLEVRRRAFAALKELLASVAQRLTLVIHVDDLQWGDADSVQLLEAVLSSPAPRPLLLVCGHRSELAASSDALAALRQARERLEGACDFQEIEVGELSHGEACDLARSLLDSGDPASAEAVAREARGSPLFVAELARWSNERREVARTEGAITLEHVILARVAELPEDARSLLEVLSVAGGPLERAIAEKAADLGAGRRAAMTSLRAARFMSARGLREEDLLETTHDKIRETVAAGLSEEQRRTRHLGIARAFATSANPEPAFEHFRAAGDDEGAREHALRAAEAAERALAFLRAASLYRAAIGLKAGAPDTLFTKLGDALANAGRGADAADAYMQAAAQASPRDALDLRRTAADHYLKSGRTERGLEVLRGVLAAADLRYPESTAAAVASIVWHDARLRVASMVQRVRRVRRAQSLSPRDLARIDAAFTAATGLAMTDLLRGADFAMRALVLALEAGEPVRLGRALAVAAGNLAARGESARARADEFVLAAQRVAAQVDDPHGRALALLIAGLVHFFLGEWRSAQAKLEDADQILRTRCRAVSWELANTEAWICNSLILSGQLGKATARVPGLLEEARARDDRFALAHLTYPACVANIAADDVEAAWRVTQYSRRGGGFSSADWGAFIAECSVERYRGNARAAWKRVEEVSPVLDASDLGRVALVRACSAYERGLSAVAAAAAGHDRTRALNAADHFARKLVGEKVAYGRAMGHLLQAGAHAARGHDTRALDSLDRAIPLLDTADLGYLAACARHRRGELAGGSEGDALTARSRAFFEAQGVTNVERCLAMSAPGFHPGAP